MAEEMSLPAVCRRRESPAEATTAAVCICTDSPPQEASREAADRARGDAGRPERAERPLPSSRKPASSARLRCSPRGVCMASSPESRENTPADSMAPVSALKATTYPQTESMPETEEATASVSAPPRASPGAGGGEMCCGAPLLRRAPVSKAARAWEA